MAQPYIAAIEHLDLRAKDVMSKHAKKRALGRIEKQYKYTPPQPVLSCRTVDIDSSGTRTYRAVSNTDILEEQHRLIHQIYTRARNISSAPARTRTPSYDVPPSRQQTSTSGIRFLKVEGQGNRPGSRLSTTSPSPRPGTSPRQGTQSPRTPHGSGSPRKTKSAIDSRLIPPIDPDYETCSHRCQQVEQLVREQWQDDKHSLAEGKFVRGKKPEGSSSLDSKTGSQWLAFGGGHDYDANSGVIDAFTGMAETGEYFSIDGRTGSQVARQVNQGDTILIGRNGSAPPRYNKQNTYSFCHGHHTIPLCWEDQVSSSGVKFLKPREPRPDKPPRMMSETWPVVFEPLTKEDSPKKVQNNQKSKPKSGYHVNVTTRSRVGVDGRVSTTPMTNISIGTSKDEVNPAAVSVDDILGNQFHSRSRGPRGLITQTSKESRPGLHVGGTGQRTSGRQAVEKRDSTRAMSVPSSHKEMEPSSGANTDHNTQQVRSMTPVGQASQLKSPTTSQSDLSQMVVHNIGSGPAPERVSSPERQARVSSAGRPPRARTPLGHKPAAQKTDAEYIQITQQLQVRSGSGTGLLSPSPNLEGGSIPPRPLPDRPASRATASPLAPLIDIDDSADVCEAHSSQPPPSPEPAPEQSYAFNIPTADIWESEVNSLVDISEAAISEASAHEHRNGMRRGEVPSSAAAVRLPSPAGSDHVVSSPVGDDDASSPAGEDTTQMAPCDPDGETLSNQADLDQNTQLPTHVGASADPETNEDPAVGGQDDDNGVDASEEKLTENEEISPEENSDMDKTTKQAAADPVDSSEDQELAGKEPQPQGEIVQDTEEELPPPDDSDPLEQEEDVLSSTTKSVRFVDSTGDD